jgi:predicted metal-dependent enzyme (double-stranded beta helix superfamily)
MEAARFETVWLAERVVTPTSFERSTRTRKVATPWLFYDHGLQIHLSPYIRKDTTIPTHNHGVRELVGVYRGAADHSLYLKIDDGSEWDAHGPSRWRRE